MPRRRLPWQQELQIIDTAMRGVSDVTDPDLMVRAYWDSIRELLPDADYLALSRRGVEPPDYLITRSARFVEHFNPWKERHRLPRLRGGLLGEIAYADAPVVIENLPERLREDDPGYFYLRGYQALVALPQYEGGRGVNIGMTLYESGEEFDPSRVPMMHWQASLFGRGTQNLVLRNQLQSALAALDRELRTVGQIQRSLLPATLPDLPGLEFAAHYHTSASAGGDYYDFFPLEGGRLGIFIADVSGHGTPAAVLMAITHALAHTAPGSLTPPHDVLSHLNSRLARSYTLDGSFVTAFYAVFDPATRRLTYSCAGHNPPRLRRGQTVRSLDSAAGLPLGVLDDQSFPQSSIDLASGDLLLLYTDGITEAMPAPASDGRAELFGVERLDALLAQSHQCSARECVELITREVAAFVKGAPAADDQTLLAMRCTPRP
ncbi:MAG: stage II sporulation protein E [Leptolyngbya sp. PLA1]|nr:stage II sporulation protein E [Leptolyngbya sp. PLA1]